MVTLFTFGAAATSAVTYLPQLLLVLRGHTAGVRPETWAALAAANVVWLAYAVSVWDFMQIVVNAWLLCVNATIAMGALAHARELRRATFERSARVAVAGVLSAALGGAAASGTLAVAIVAYSLFPQVAHVVRDPAQAAGVSRATWRMQFINQTAWVGYGVLVAQPAVYVAATIVLVSAVLILSASSRADRPAARLFGAFPSAAR